MFFFLTVIINNLTQVFISISISNNNIKTNCQDDQVFLSLFLIKLLFFLFVGFFLRGITII